MVWSDSKYEMITVWSEHFSIWDEVKLKIRWIWYEVSGSHSLFPLGPCWLSPNLERTKLFRTTLGIGGGHLYLYDLSISKFANFQNFYKIDLEYNLFRLCLISIWKGNMANVRLTHFYWIEKEWYITWLMYISWL